jgi:hypothetical protein
MARVLLDHFIASYAQPPQGIVLAVDDTEDRGHGPQEQARYDGYYGGSGCMPRPLYEGLSGRLITTILKAKRCTGTQRLAVLKRLVKRLRQAWPHTLLILRGDRHLASPEGMQGIEDQPALSAGTGLTRNAILQARAREVVEPAQGALERSGPKVTRFHSTRSQAGTWVRSRRVVIKVEVSDQGVNTRFVVTALAQARTQVLYRHLSGARGQSEHESKAHTLDLKAERPACHRFAAHQLRFLWHSAASVFLDTLRRDVVRATQWASATRETIQLRLLKLGARVQACQNRLQIS